MALPIFAVTLFISAFLLFLVQPMIGKMILPKLGGTPQVWNTCMVFFQTVLLAGYFYTHASTTYLKPRRQMIVHGLLLILPLILIFMQASPFDVSGWDPPAGTNPIFETLKLLAIVVGVPFFVVSTSAPLLQRWFSFSGDKTADDPYFLYGASNLGSLLSLVAYPFIIEPAMVVQAQAWMWTFGYAVLAVTILASAGLVWHRAGMERATGDLPTQTPATDSHALAAASSDVPETAIQQSPLIKKKGLKTAVSAAPLPSGKVQRYDPQTAPLTWMRCIRWIMLAAVASGLMLGVTSYVSTDLSPFPLLWAIPLSFYLLSFILVFAKWPVKWTETPHTVFLYLTPIAIAALCMVIFSRDYSPVWPTRISFAAFLIITMALHGELAKDRPAARHLTEFFLWMSVGGMIGGVFNAIMAPVIFTGVVEYPLAIFAACLLRPSLTENGLTDGWMLQNPATREWDRTTSHSLAESFGQKSGGRLFATALVMDLVLGVAIVLVAYFTISNSNTVFRWLSGFFDFIGLPESFTQTSQMVQFATYGIPIILALIVCPRSLRYAIAIGGILLIASAYGAREGQVYAGRSYFGILRVAKDEERPFRLTKDDRVVPWFTESDDLPRDMASVPYNFLMHGSTYHGRNYQVDPLKRLATTYYHRFGPVGIIMEKYNWFPGKQNTYTADVRMPIAMIGLGASGFGTPLPGHQLANVWSDPPFATVGLGTGTMASYCRWLQHLTYYEIDDKIRDMSVPPGKGDPFFNYVQGATDRGGLVEIVMGDARQSLQNEAKREKTRLEKKEGGPTAMREGYYKVIELDAFSSDAIPVHLITKEAMELYLDKLAPDGVLCVHTSNRHLSLPRPVADICRELKLDAFLGNDSGEARERGQKFDGSRIYSMGHFGSEYVMVARKGVLKLDQLRAPIKGYPADKKTNVVRWGVAPVPGARIWTDHYQDIVSIMRHGQE